MDVYSATWDVTVTDTVAASNLNATSHTAGSAAEAATSWKDWFVCMNGIFTAHQRSMAISAKSYVIKTRNEKYAAISSNYLFFQPKF
jgi:hypothetical protein